MTRATIMICLQICLHSLQAQDSLQTTQVSRWDDVNEQVTQKAFRYKDYTNGVAVFNDNSVTAAKMNYSLLSGKVLFISPKGDTLEIAQPGNFKMVAIGSDSFYVSGGSYLEKLTHYPTVNLAVLQAVKFIGTEKKGAYGTYSATAAITSFKSFNSDGQITSHLGPDERVVFKLNNSFFISDRKGNFLPANRKNFLKQFPAHEKEAKDFLEQKKINFNKKADLEKLVQFAQAG